MWKTTILQHGHEFSFDSSTFSEHWCPENKTNQRFHEFRAQKSENQKRRKRCAWQAKHDFETFRAQPKNLASAIGVSDFTFSIKKLKRFKDQKRRFRFRGVEKSSRSGIIKKSNQNEVEQSKSSELVETSDKNIKTLTKNIQNIEIKKEDFSWEGASFLGRQRSKQNRTKERSSSRICDRGQRFWAFCWR